MEISKLSVCLLLIGIGLVSALVGFEGGTRFQGSNVAQGVITSVSSVAGNLTPSEGKNVTVIGSFVSMDSNYVLRDEVGASYIALNLSHANIMPSTLQSLNGTRVVIRGTVVVNASFSGIDVSSLTIL